MYGDGSGGDGGNGGGCVNGTKVPDQKKRNSRRYVRVQKSPQAFPKMKPKGHNDCKFFVVVVGGGGARRWNGSLNAIYNGKVKA